MKVAFYFRNDIYDSSKDLRDLYQGNPGIGGTEYVMLIVAHQLLIRDNDIEVFLYSNKFGLFPSEFDVHSGFSVESAATDAALKGCRRFVLDYRLVNWRSGPFADLSPDVKLIPWCHTFYDDDELHAICSHLCFGRLICVGSEQRDLYRDDWTFDYTDYIFNCVPVNPIRIQEVYDLPYKQRKHIVTYVGSLNARKTFHVLAEIWPDVLKRVPDAKLYVIGSASLYDKVESFGDFGIAEKNYEDTFMPYLSKNGQIIDSVRFLGPMGKEKNSILQLTKVGVPNPTGKTETFCLSAVEMQAMGCAVTAMRAPGYFDTIYNGKIVKNKKQLTKAIVELLLSDNTPRSYSDTMNYIQSNFSVPQVVGQWERLLKSDLSERINPIVPISHISYRLKWIKVAVRIIKKCFPLFNRINYSVERGIIKFGKMKHKDYRLK